MIGTPVRAAKLFKDLILGHRVILMSVDTDRLRFLFIASRFCRFRIVPKVISGVIVHCVDHFMSEQCRLRKVRGGSIGPCIRAVRHIRIIKYRRIAALARCH